MDMRYEPTNGRRLTTLIIGALVVWGLLLGLGAYLGLDPATPDRDFRRLWMVAAIVGGFVLSWVGLLALRRRK
jgi:hypothetical protein